MTVPDDARARAGEQGCPEATVLAAYLDGNLPAAEQAALERHLLSCADCRAVVAEAAILAAAGPGASGESGDLPRDRQVVGWRRRWIAVSIGGLAAAAALVLATQLGNRRSIAEPDIAPLIRVAAMAPTRLADARLVGFAYGAPPRILRGTTTSEDVTPAVRAEAAKIEMEAAAPGRTADHLLGVAHLALGHLDSAVAALQRAAAASPDDPKVLSDLAAALVARGVTASSSTDATASLQASEHAIRLDARLPEALFNRAVAFEALDRRSDAEQAWAAYLRIDAVSPWADEARRRSQALH